MMPDNEELVERLRTDAAWSAKRVAATPRQIGRDCAEAATLIEQLSNRVERLTEALSPSGDTKAAYHGEFAFDVPLDGWDEEGEPLEGLKRVYVPWDTVKQIMAAIKARAALTGEHK